MFEVLPDAFMLEIPSWPEFLGGNYRYSNNCQISNVAS